jgi:hypothetical protein
MIGLGPSTVRCVRLDVVTVCYWRASIGVLGGEVYVTLLFVFCAHRGGLAVGLRL